MTLSDTVSGCPMKLADLKLAIANLEQEHGPEILQEPVFCYEGQSGDLVVATSLSVVIATHQSFKNALVEAGFTTHSKIAVILT